MTNSRWHWNCTDCGAHGNGNEDAVTWMVTDHATKTRHMLNYWPRGRKDQAQHFCDAEARYGSSWKPRGVAMTNRDVYEQAAKQMSPLQMIHNKQPVNMVEIVQFAAGAVWTAQYGCPQCDGNKIKPDERDGVTFFDGCSADHVVMVNPHTKVQVYCDPAKAEGNSERPPQLVRKAYGSTLIADMEYWVCPVDAALGGSDDGK